MAKRNSNRVNRIYWTTQAWNEASQRFFLDQLMTLAMSRFRWDNLPAKVDARFLEYTLLTQGVATLSWPAGFQPANAFAMQAMAKGAPDANANWPEWTSIGVNGVKYDTQRNVNGVIVWDTTLRRPIMPMLEWCAGELANILRTKQTVRQHMRQPVIVSGPRESGQQLKALTAQIGGGEPYILVNDGFSQVETQVLPIASGKEADELAALERDRQDTWNMALQALGISLSERKAERQTTVEIQQSDQPSTLQGMGSLIARRQACAELNKLTGGNTQVYWNADVESDSYNMLNNMQLMLNANAVGQAMNAFTQDDETEDTSAGDDDAAETE